MGAFFILEGMCKSHDSITDKLKLSLKLGIFSCQPLISTTSLLVILIIWRGQTSGITTLEVILPEF